MTSTMGSHARRYPWQGRSSCLYMGLQPFNWFHPSPLMAYCSPVGYPRTALMTSLLVFFVKQKSAAECSSGGLMLSKWYLCSALTYQKSSTPINIRQYRKDQQTRRSPGLEIGHLNGGFQYKASRLGITCQYPLCVLDVVFLEELGFWVE